MEGRRPPGPRRAVPSRVCPREEMAGWVFFLCYPGRCPPPCRPTRAAKGETAMAGDCIQSGALSASREDAVRRATAMQSGSPHSKPLRCSPGRPPRYQHTGQSYRTILHVASNFVFTPRAVHLGSSAPLTKTSVIWRYMALYGVIWRYMALPQQTFCSEFEASTFRRLLTTTCTQVHGFFPVLKMTTKFS
jgi:hypothetical protein